MDFEFLEQAKEIDNHMLSQMMDEYGNDVWNYAYFLTRSAEQADELSQEVFIRAYLGISQFRGQCALKTWLLTITRNTTFTYRKSKFFRSSQWGDVLPMESGGADVRGLASIPEMQAYPSAEAEAIRREHMHEI